LVNKIILKGVSSQMIVLINKNVFVVIQLAIYKNQSNCQVRKTRIQ